jgi:hypothetical protein
VHLCIATNTLLRGGFPNRAVSIDAGNDLGFVSTGAVQIPPHRQGRISSRGEVIAGRAQPIERNCSGLQKKQIAPAVGRRAFPMPLVVACVASTTGHCLLLSCGKAFFFHTPRVLCPSRRLPRHVRSHDLWFGLIGLSVGCCLSRRCFQSLLRYSASHRSARRLGIVVRLRVMKSLCCRYPLSDSVSDIRTP